jgi:uncharacterized protein YbaR (Trm112 family)/ubiquinone/menaquinone biosynthesis C-methylase UbiE
MKRNVLNTICCPHCRADLKVLSVVKRTEEHIIDGVLECERCGARFPILGKIPRLVKMDLLAESERQALHVFCDQKHPHVEIISEAYISTSERYARIEKMVRSKIRTDLLLSDRLQERAEHDIQYKVYDTEKKEKFIRTLNPFLTVPPRRIVEIGGGQGGLIGTLREYYQPELAMLIDLDAAWTEVALLRDPNTEVVRADATQLPIKDGACDLMISTSTLEHISDWRSVIKEMVRISTRGFLSYGPNGFFPYDIGHLDAPLVTFLPKKYAALCAHLWHILMRTGRSLDSIKEELNSISYIPRPVVTRELSKNGAKVKNVFGEFLYHSVNSDYHYYAEGLKVFLKRHQSVLKVLSKTMVCLAMEPMVYLVYESPCKNKRVSRENR